MSGFEKIVRPFQDGDVFNARVLPPVQPAFVATTDVAHLEWEGGANAAWSEEPPPGTIGFTATWEEDVSRRKTETVRITNKDDTDQFVDVERIKSMVLKNDTTKEEIPIKMNWDKTP